MENFENKILGVVCNDAGGAEVVSSWIKNNKYKTLYLFVFSLRYCYAMVMVWFWYDHDMVMI